MHKACWRGRFVDCPNPDVILDGAHNPAAALELKRSIELYYKDRNLHYIFGVFRDKDYRTIIALTAPYKGHYNRGNTGKSPCPAG